MEKEEGMDFKDLIVKFLSGEIGEDELIILKKWLEEDVANRKVFDKENELWQEVSFLQKHEYFNPDPAWILLADKLDIGVKRKSKVHVITRTNYILLIAAASIALLLAIGGFTLYIAGQKTIGKMNDSFQAFTTIVSTSEGEKSHVYLWDGSSVYLNSGSTLQYNASYNEAERAVDLTGEAYFEVKTNPEKPFIVNAGDVKVVAKGTTFNVLSYENENRIETTLEEGKVDVVIKDAEPVSIIAGQQVVYYKDSEDVLVKVAAPDTYTSWKENKLRFYNTTFMEAMRGISRRYNVKIEITDPALLDLTYNATFIDESIEEVFQFLKSISPINYKINYQTTEADKIYTKPKIVVGSRKR